MKRTIQTASYMEKMTQYIKWKALDEIDVGICDGMTYKVISSFSSNLRTFV